MHALARRDCTSLRREDLTPKQLEVVGAEDHSILVYGAAGTGKTTTAIWAARERLEHDLTDSWARALFLTFSRTAVNQIATTAQFEAYKAHDDITEEYEYVATLDTRTTPICMSLDGRTWRYDDPSGRRPPQHWSCRSTIVPVVDFKALGLPTPPEGKRAAVGGPVPAGQNYEQWLRKQSTAKQNEALGPARGKLFREGKASLNDFVRDNGTTVTLDQLRKAG